MGQHASPRRSEVQPPQDCGHAQEVPGSKWGAPHVHAERGALKSDQGRPTLLSRASGLWKLAKPGHSFSFGLDEALIKNVISDPDGHSERSLR